MSLTHIVRKIGNHCDHYLIGCFLQKYYFCRNGTNVWYQISIGCMDNIQNHDTFTGSRLHTVNFLYKVCVIIQNFICSLWQFTMYSDRCFTTLGKLFIVVYVRLWNNIVLWQTLCQKLDDDSASVKCHELWLATMFVNWWLYLVWFKTDECKLGNIQNSQYCRLWYICVAQPIIYHFSSVHYVCYNYDLSEVMDWVRMIL